MTIKEAKEIVKKYGYDTRIESEGDRMTSLSNAGQLDKQAILNQAVEILSQQKGQIPNGKRYPGEGGSTVYSFSRNADIHLLASTIANAKIAVQSANRKIEKIGLKGSFNLATVRPVLNDNDKQRTFYEDKIWYVEFKF
jgi:hypothetical protein